jgi:S-adenosylmethionine synthetase
MVDSKRTGKVSDEKLTEIVRRHFDLTPKGLIKHLRLRRPIYRATAAYGHFGREEKTFTWERTDKARALARAV